MMTDTDFDIAFRRHFDQVVRVAGSIVGNGAEAEDIAAEAFARAYLRRRQLRDDYLRAWLLRVATNLAIDSLRGRDRRTRRDLDIVRRDAVQVDLAQSVIDTGWLRQALLALSPNQRRVVSLHYLADLSEETTGEVLGMAPGTVKSHLNRARSSLRTQLCSDGGNHA